MKPDFQERTRDPLGWLKKGIIGLVSVWIVIALISGHRAIWQVQKLELGVPDEILKPGSTIAVKTRSSGRVNVRVVLELVQGARAETLATQRLPSNHPTFIPRWRNGVLDYTVTPALLERFQSGSAIVRATGLGAPQWTRTPPPTVREQPVRLLNR